MSLAGVGQCSGGNEANVFSIALNSMHPEHLWFFLNGHLLGTIDLHIPRAYCTCKYSQTGKNLKSKVLLVPSMLDKVGNTFFFFLQYWGIQGLHLEPLYQPFFMMGFFKIGSQELFCPEWLRTTILLISAS
jgi:hypothetical protein